jgi:hypothetical protein
VHLELPTTVPVRDVECDDVRRIVVLRANALGDSSTTR